MEEVILTNLNKNKMAEVKRKSMFKRMFARMMAQYKPVKSAQLKMTWDGTVVLKNVIGDDETYIGINANNEIVSYDPEFIVDFPIYLIDRQYSQINSNDIVLISEGTNAMYGKVIKVNKSNIEVLCFNGNNLTINKKKNFLTNTETICTVLNMFDMFSQNSNTDSSQMNSLMMPMLLSGMMNDEKGSTSDNDHGNESLFMMFYMMQNQKQNNNPIMGMLPMMMLNNKGSNKSEMFETLMIMQMIQNGNFSNMFGPYCSKIDEVKTVKKNNIVKSDKKDKQKDTEKDPE